MNKTAFAALLCLFIAIPAYAGDMYAGIKLGRSRHSIPAVTNSPKAIGFIGGYRLDPAFTIEAGYIDLGNFGGNKATSVDISALFFYPGNDPFSMYAKISYAGTKWHVPGQTEQNSSFTHGLGFRYIYSPSTIFRLSWDRYMIGNPDVVNVDVYYFAGLYSF